MLRLWLKQRVLPEFSGRALSADTAVAQRRARLHVPVVSSDGAVMAGERRR